MARDGVSSSCRFAILPRLGESESLEEPPKIAIGIKQGSDRNQTEIKEVDEMEGITDAMKQYERATDEIVKRKPKRGKAYGIKVPDSMNIMAGLTGLFVLFVLIAELM